MRYELKLASTTSGVGYFTAFPMEEGSVDEKLAYLRSCPLDDYMHRHLLDTIGRLDAETAGKIFEVARGRDAVMMTILLEASLSFSHLEELKPLFDLETIKHLCSLTPLIDIKSSLRADQQAHTQWIRIFDRNISQWHPIQPTETVCLPNLYPRDQLRSNPTDTMPVSVLFQNIEDIEAPLEEALPSAAETAHRALERLEAVGVLAGPELAHRSSLSPHGFLRKWHLGISVRNGRHDFELTGTQTSYGKGLTEDSARASYAMEVVERYSSFTSVAEGGLQGFQKGYELRHGSHEELASQGLNVLDPNTMRLEAPYDNEPLYWLEADQVTADGHVPILIPVQTVFLFSNLDEINLFSGLGSTGLASGNTLEQAKVSALLEVIERDCETTMLHHPSRCFDIATDDATLNDLLEDYKTNGIRVQFEELTHELGVPCYRCAVIDSRGAVVKGTGAHLDGRKALLSALTETPYPFPGGPPSGPGLDGLKTRRFEDLPNTSSGHPSRDLKRLESLLTANGYLIIYVDLTREDLGIPVVRAIVPGMELAADFDRYSRVSPRLFTNYLREFGESVNW